ncbi:hypothetical protein WDH52_23805 [Streptomyces sp. TRM70308]|uniref:hypothetical protein n=1 Tax=Streptomyces sp. TRM70308 TaxID=3131932 RepID=UPI003D080C3C
MPRPNPAQLAFGFLAVVLTAVVLLLLTRTESGVGAILVASGSLAAGLLAAVAAPIGRPSPAARPEPTAASAERPLAAPSLRR